MSVNAAPPIAKAFALSRRTVSTEVWLTPATIGVNDLLTEGGEKVVRVSLSMLLFPIGSAEKRAYEVRIGGLPSKAEAEALAIRVEPITGSRGRAGT